MSLDGIAIEAHGLTRRFGPVVAVDHAELSIPRARIYGFLGPNGSGKSTTMRMLCGLIRPTSGTIRVLGLEIPRQAETLRTQVGYMTQRFSLCEDLSARENLAFMASIYTLEPAHAARAHRRRHRGISGWRNSSTGPPARSAAGRSSAWRWPPRHCTSRSCCCSTSRPARSTRRAGAISGRACSR